MSDQAGLPQKDIDNIAEAYRGFPTVIMGAIVMPVRGIPNTLRVISIDEACQIIRDRQAPMKFDLPNSLEFVIQTANVYHRY